MQQGVPVKGKDMLWVDTQDAMPVGTTLCFEIKGAQVILFSLYSVFDLPLSSIAAQMRRCQSPPLSAQSAGAAVPQRCHSGMAAA